MDSPSILNSSKLYRVFQAFFERESSGGILLVLCAAVAMVLANSPLGNLYQALWQQHVYLGVADFQLGLSLREWINDGLMAIFFLVVGLEIKRELLVGELSNPKQAALPILSAFGGMLFPALIYFLLNPPGSAGHAGWGIPTVTDIAFSLGVLALLGNRVPFGLKVFLVALAIADDVGAVLLIAAFYSKTIAWPNVFGVLGLFAFTLLLNRLKLRHAIFYIVAGIGLWLLMLGSGIHPTLSGILLAIAIPSQSPASSSDSLLHQFEQALHPWSTFLILPLFALANAGISMQGLSFQDLWSTPMPLGIMAGLILGKQLGVTLFAWLSVKSGLGSLSEGVTWKQLYAVSWLAGIGFTMSIFMSNLAFQDAQQLSLAKLAVFSASLMASVGGLFLTWRFTRHNLSQDLDSV